jgi:hypothetical protein
MLVTLEDAKNHLLIYFTDSKTDSDLTLKIKAASGAVLNYLKNRKNLYQPEIDQDGYPILDSKGDQIYLLDSQGERIIRDEVRSATLILIGYFFRDRDGQEGDKWAPGFLPAPVTALLYPLRDPALA